MTITAQFHGRCSDCSETIAPGQEIQRDADDDDWEHVRCNARPVKVECVCQDCWLVHAGSCA